jgi:hypothetical protein
VVTGWMVRRGVDGHNTGIDPKRSEPFVSRLGTIDPKPPAANGGYRDINL